MSDKVNQTFGKLEALPDVPTTIVLIATILFIIILEYILKFVDSISQKYYRLGIFQSILQYELIVLGLISFFIFLLQASFAKQATSSVTIYISSFSFANLIITFIAISLSLQVILIILISRNDGSRHLKHIRYPEIDLLKMYTQSQSINARGRQGKLPKKYWLIVECKLLQHLFYHTYRDRIPPGFDYGAYTGHLYHIYLAEVSKISPFSWIGLAILILINYLKNTIIPSNLECQIFHAIKHVPGTIIVDCTSTYYSYPFVLGLILLISLCVLMIASSWYYHCIIDDCITRIYRIPVPPESLYMKIKGLLSWCYPTYTSPRHLAYIQCLEQIQCNQFQDKTVSSPSLITQSSTNEGVGTTTTTTMTLNQSQLTNIKQHNNDDEDENNHGNTDNTPITDINTNDQWKSDDPLSSYTIYLDRLNAETAAKQHERQMLKLRPWYTKMHIYLYSFVTFLQNKYLSGNKELSRFFLCGSSSLYFFFIEFFIFLHSVYVAVFLSQLIPSAASPSYYGWAIALGSIPIFGYILIRHIISHAVVLYSVIRLNSDIMLQICHDSHELHQVKKRLQSIIFHQYQIKKLITIDTQIDYIKDLFNSYDNSNCGHLYPLQFRQLLGDLQMYLPKEQFNLLWEYIDLDLSGQISREEILYFFFPQVRAVLVRGTLLVYRLNRYFMTCLHASHISMDKWHMEIVRILQDFNTKLHTPTLSNTTTTTNNTTTADTTTNNATAADNTTILPSSSTDSTVLAATSAAIDQLEAGNTNTPQMVLDFDSNILDYYTLKQFIFDIKISTSTREISHLMRSLQPTVHDSNKGSSLKRGYSALHSSTNSTFTSRSDSHGMKLTIRITELAQVILDVDQRLHNDTATINTNTTTTKASDRTIINQFKTTAMNLNLNEHHPINDSNKYLLQNSSSRISYRHSYSSERHTQFDNNNPLKMSFNNKI